MLINNNIYGIYRHLIACLCFPCGSVVNNLPAMQETQDQSLIRKIPWRRAWQPTLVILPREFHGQRRLAACSPSVSSVQSLSHIWLFLTPWTAACQASLSITNSQSVLKLMSIKSGLPSNHLILCRPLLLLPSISPSIRVFSNESVFLHQVAKVLELQLQHQFFHEYSGLISLGWIGWISLQSKGLRRVFSNTTVQSHQFFGTQLSLWSNSHIHTWLLEKS